VDEAVVDVVKLVDIVYHFLAGVVNKFLNKGVSANQARTCSAFAARHSTQD